MTYAAPDPTARAARRRRRFRLVALLGGTLLSLLVLEVVARVWFAAMRPDYEQIRRRLAGEVDYDPQFQLCIGQAYLTYVPTPNLRSGPNRHNEQGYRGDAVPLHRTPGVARVLFLGGSTTYCWGVPDADQTYPAVVGQLLRSDLPEGYSGVEVINAGLPWGTSAELLVHYLLKFHYFKPDVVVVNEGGNDGDAVDTLWYQPDYSHFRQPVQVPLRAAPWGRRVLRSRLAAWIVIPLLYGQQPGNSALQWPKDLPPPTRWHPQAIVPGPRSEVPDEEWAFRHNLRSLLDAVDKDGARAVLVPFRLAPGTERTLSIAPHVARNEAILRREADERGLPLAPFPAEVIGAGHWLDHCHVDEEGNRRKAEHVAPFVREALQSVRKARSDGT
jgi:lysophospholipase L1-like esterase